MRLLELRMTNFMAVGSASYPMDGLGVIFIEGHNEDKASRDSNGAGKSTIFVEALAWVLFDTTLRGVSKDRVISDVEGKNTEVGLRLTVEGQTVHIVRYRNHSKHKNNVRLEVNGEDITCARVKDTQDYIDRLIQVTPDIFFRTTILGQGLTHRFSDLGDNDRKAMLEKIVGSGIFEQARQRAVAHNSQLKVEIASIDGSMSTNYSNLEPLNFELREARKKTVLFEDVRKARLLELQVQLENLKIDLDSIDLERAEEDYRNLEAHAQVLGVRTNELRQVIMHLESQRGPMHRSWGLEQNKIKSIPESVCPTCTRDISLIERSAIVDDWQNAADVLKQELDELDEKIVVAKGAEALHEKSSNEWSAKVQWSVWTDRISQLRSRDSSLRQQIVLKESSIKTQIEKQDPHTTNIESLQNRIATTKADLEILRIQHETLMVKTDYAKFWNSGFTSLRALALERSVQYINSRLQGYIETLSEGELQIALAVVKKGQKEQIGFDCGGREYESLSGGEKRRMDLAMALALHDLAGHSSGFSCNVLIADEVADSLDMSGVDRFVQFLQEKQSDVSTVFVISHNPHVRSRISRHWIVEKKNRVSSLVIPGSES